MKLSKEQINFYNKNGYLQINDFFSKKEVDLLNAEIPRTIEIDSPRVIFEKKGHVRSIFAPHFVNSVFERLGKLQRLVIIAETILKSKVYIHQYKINCKKGLESESWEWHQDFPYWHLDDAIEKPDMVNFMVYLQDTDSLNGALLLIPGSHLGGIAKFAEKDEVQLPQADLEANSNNKYHSSLSSNIKFTVEPAQISKLSESNSIVTASGKSGTLLLFHPNLYHASNNNMSPVDRNMILITYNSIHNSPCNNDSPRPAFLASREFSAIDETVQNII